MAINYTLRVNINSFIFRDIYILKFRKHNEYIYNKNYIFPFVENKCSRVVLRYIKKKLKESYTNLLNFNKIFIP